MADDDVITVLHEYLKTARGAVLWKLEGASEYDARRPMTPTGTNLLGLVKHLAMVEAAYFGDTFGRPFPDPLPFWSDDDPNVDMWATDDETPEQIADLYRRVAAHSDETITSLPPDAPGQVPWWPPERRDVTLGRIVVHMTTETYRHAGHADIVRELADGARGLRADRSNLPDADEDWWSAYRERLQTIAENHR